MRNNDNPRRASLPVGPRLRILLAALAILTAVLGADSVYLAGVTLWEAASGGDHENLFYQYMFLVHLMLGLMLIALLVTFVVVHWRNVRAWVRSPAVQFGYALAAATAVLMVTGVLLIRVGPLELKSPVLRSTVYWMHVGSPLAGLWLYWLHRLAGPRIRWRLGLGFGVAVLGLSLATLWLHRAESKSGTVGDPSQHARQFFPSPVQSADGGYIPAEALQNDDYCRECHPDIHAQWADSAHGLSSFNNPIYRASVRETMEVSRAKDGNKDRARWCAGCHDPVPLLSGRFNAPDFDDIRDPTASAGVTCTVCHAITRVTSTRGNGDYVVEEPTQYPFAFSDNRFLSWVNRQLIKANPSFHKRTFLKPHHRTAEFCSVCHKVHLPEEVNDYKFLRGQNHYDTYLLSGVSGRGARSFYYPETAEVDCNGCHMPLVPSADFAAKYFDGAAELSVHDHLFPSANTGIAFLRDRPDVVRRHQEFLDGVMRVDLFGVREGGEIDGPLIAPLRPNVPALEPGKTYLLETVVRTLKMGHHFTQGTTDSNQVWLDVRVASGDRPLGRSGGFDARRRVDPSSHFLNTFMLDRRGNRIDRRNAQDIFVPLYSHQIPPGAGQTVHYSLQVPEDVDAPIEVEVRLLYRKFDVALMDFVTAAALPGDPPIRNHKRGEAYVNLLPVTTLASDRIVFPIEGKSQRVENAANSIPAWQRFNDYGIGLLLKGTAELRQAAEAFAEVERQGRYDGPLNLARVYFAEGRLDEAGDALQRAVDRTDPPPPGWTVAWLGGLVNRQQGHLEAAEEDFRRVLQWRSEETVRRRFDFSFDYEVINLLGETLFDRARRLRGADRAAEREAVLRQAVRQFQRTLAIDSENVTAHYNLSLLLARLGDEQGAGRHQKLHQKYKLDDNARDQVFSAARRRYPAADRAAEKVVIYPLTLPESPEPAGPSPSSNSSGENDK